MLNIPQIRADFPILTEKIRGKQLVYLDNGASTQKPQAVIDAESFYYEHQYANIHRGVHYLSQIGTDLYEGVRKQVQHFINAKHEHEVIFTKGTTNAINLVAYTFGRKFINEGDEIVVTEMEHHSNIVPWQMLCEDRGAILKVIPMNDKGELLQDEYAKLLTNKTKIVALAHVSNALGTINPIKDMIKLAHQKGAKVLIDGAQAAPHLPIDVQELDCDFYVFSGHKVYGPTGIGILYGKIDLLEAMPPYQGGGDMIEKVTFPKTTYNVPPYKFEAGTPMIAEVIGMGAAIDFMNQVGKDKIQAYEHSLLEYATEKMKNIEKVRIIGTAAQKGAIISFVVENIHALDIGTMMDLKGFAIRTGHHCAQPVMRHFNIPATSRISFGVYNTKEEIDRFIIALQDVIGMF